MCYQATQVAGVVVHGDAVEGVVQHLLVDLVHTARNRLHQSAATYHGIKAQGFVHAIQLVEHQLLAVLQLIQHIVAKLGQLFVGMCDATQYPWLLVFIDGHLG